MVEPNKPEPVPVLGIKLDDSGFLCSVKKDGRTEKTTSSTFIQSHQIHDYVSHVHGEHQLHLLVTGVSDVNRRMQQRVLRFILIKPFLAAKGRDGCGS